MAYSKFTLEMVVESFDLKLNYIPSIFLDAVSTVPVSDILRKTLERNTIKALRINTEKARSELIVAPILVELQEICNNEIAFFSGIAFNVDKHKGLMGACDFLISIDRNQGFLTAPLISVVEAKNDNVNYGLGQCIAEMVAAQLFNANKKREIKIIYGVVTNGIAWKLIKLIDNQVFIEEGERSYDIDSMGELLGIFLKMLDQH
ncbi:MAG: hypothetical protein MUE30_02995 [Spirosomaceae bacterium]|jgi:hypothetical protein|nr:hypothetical protein [Spirosomataceae bacterium]